MNPVHFFPFQTDVIVNSVNPLEGLRRGLVSKSILQHAGKEMEQEFNNKKTKIRSDSQLVLVTKGFKLSCQCVYHVLWYSGCPKPNLVRSK